MCRTAVNLILKEKFTLKCKLCFVYSLSTEAAVFNKWKKHQYQHSHRNLWFSIMMLALVSLQCACRFATILLKKPLPQNLHAARCELEAHWLTTQVFSLKDPDRNVCMYCFVCRLRLLRFRVWFKKSLMFVRKLEELLHVGGLGCDVKESLPSRAFKMFYLYALVWNIPGMLPSAFPHWTHLPPWYLQWCWSARTTST